LYRRRVKSEENRVIWPLGSDCVDQDAQKEYNCGNSSASRSICCIEQRRDIPVYSDQNQHQGLQNISSLRKKII
ncbi:MAG: hypothetical protein MHMPM18_003742, partial [Marteilia pararefringens]